ncbi:hypothetical protein AAHZ94_33685, partial [Streptomyces sp. HSW2009]
PPRPAPPPRPPPRRARPGRGGAPAGAPPRPPPAAVVARAARAEAVEQDQDALRISAPVVDRIAVLTETVRELAAAGIEARDIALRRPTLDEVFLELTGSRPEDRAGGGAGAEADAGSDAGAGARQSSRSGRAGRASQDSRGEQGEREAGA